jgi:hypothetical protein
MVMMLSLLRDGNPRPSCHERSPWVLPAGTFPEAFDRRGSVSTAAYVKYCMPDYDPFLGPDSSVG